MVVGVIIPAAAHKGPIDLQLPNPNLSTIRVVNRVPYSTNGFIARADPTGRLLVARYLGTVDDVLCDHRSAEVLLNVAKPE